MRFKMVITALVTGVVLAAAPGQPMADVRPGQRSAKVAALQGRAAGLKTFFATQREAARSLPRYAVSHGVEAYGGLFGLGLGHHAGGEVAFQRTYDGAGKVRPALRVGLHAGGGLMLAIGTTFMKKVFRGKQAKPAGVWGSATAENAAVLGVGAMHARSAIGRDHAAGGVGVGLMVMDGGHVKHPSHVVEGGTMGTVRGGVTIPIWGAIRSSWSRAADRGHALAERAGALLANPGSSDPKSIVQAARLLGRAEKLQKKVQRLEAKRSAEAAPGYIPLAGLNSSPL